MADFNLNNFVIDRVVRGVALSQKDNSVLFSINQMQDVSLNCSSESTDAMDALGTPIATFYRAKTAEFSASNAIFDMQLMATQMGTEKKVGHDDQDPAKVVKVTVPAMEIITVDGSTVTLKHNPTKLPTEIYALNGDSTFGEKYEKADAVAVGKFTIATSTTGGVTKTTVGIPKYTDTEDNNAEKLLPNGTQLFVMYEYETTKAVEVTNSATKFPVGCKFVMEVLGCDVCDQTTMVYAYVIFPNFKLSPDMDWSIATDGTHPFSGKAQQDLIYRSLAA